MPNHRIIDITYTGLSADRPVIAQLARDFGLDVSILGAALETEGRIRAVVNRWVGVHADSLDDHWTHVEREGEPPCGRVEAGDAQQRPDHTTIARFRQRLGFPS